MGDQQSVAEVAATVTALGPQHVVVTGGEPLLMPEVTALCHTLRAKGMHITIETAGTVFLDAPVDLMSISPKLASSAPPTDTPGGWAARHAAARRRDEVLLALMAGDNYQLKFVIDSPTDLAEATAWIDDLAAARAAGIDRTRVLFMPQGRGPEELAASISRTASTSNGSATHAGHSDVERPKPPGAEKNPPRRDFCRHRRH